MSEDPRVEGIKRQVQFLCADGSNPAYWDDVNYLLKKLSELKEEITTLKDPHSIARIAQDYLSVADKEKD